MWYSRATVKRANVSKQPRERETADIAMTGVIRSRSGKCGVTLFRFPSQNLIGCGNADAP
jgi:hypothetical protein